MINKYKKWEFLSLMLVINLTLVGCGIFSGVETNPVSTVTPTNSGGMAALSNPCEGHSGTLEMQILVGPSEAVGMEPIAVGDIPFIVVNKGDRYSIEGGGPLNFEPQVITAEWGSYTVYFDANTKVTGSCILSDDGEMLDMIVSMSGEQLVEVVVEGIQRDYPWSGTHELQVTFPLEDGAQGEGEGWLLILHLDH